MGIFQQIWNIIAIPLGYIMRWCYLLVNDVLGWQAASYVLALFLFALVTRALQFPLALRQQRSTARMQAYNPMIQQINEKYKNNPQKRQEELQKFQQEHGYSPMSGCLPMLIQFPIIFGLVEVIYNPLTYMFRMSAETLAPLKALFTTEGETASRFIETMIIEAAKTNPSMLTNAGATAETVEQIASINMSIGPINLWENPSFSWPIILIPLFSIVTMVLSSIISSIASGTFKQSGQGTTMLVTTVLMSGLFAWFSFTYPAGFSLYWGFQNLIMIGQSFIMRKIVNVDKIKAEIEQQMEEKKKEKKKKTTVKLKDAKGNEVEKAVSADELARLRLQRAREIDEARYTGAEDDE